MPAVVTFDPVNRRIIEISAAGNNSLNLDEIYSEWKEWVKIGDNAKHPQAFRQVGGDPLTATSSLGTTFFLLNSWKMRPAEEDHQLTVVGNLFTDPEGESPYVTTVGSFTVNINSEVSAIFQVDSLGAIELNSELARKFQQNRLETDPVTGVMTLYDDDDVTVLLSGQLYEDVAALQTYRGQGAERRNKLT